MIFLNLILLYIFVPLCIISSETTILTDWKKTTWQCMKTFLEDTKYSMHDNNVTITGLDEKEDSLVRNVILKNNNELVSQFHQFENQPLEREMYYSKLIHILNSPKKTFMVFAENSLFNHLYNFQQDNENVKIIWCNNGKCISCEEQKPRALAIMNQVSEIKNIDSNKRNQLKNKASDKSWEDETIGGAKSFILELSPYSILTGISGETVKLYFRVINKQWMPLEFNFHCSDQMGLIRSVLPTTVILPPNSAPFDVMVVLEVIGPEGSTDQITFSVMQPEFDSIKVNFYIGKLIGDTTRPTINYIFNGDCRFADTPHNCASEKWNIEATIQDDNSGLAMISSIPHNLRFRNEFEIGTRQPIVVYYSATCCFPKIEIIATDLRGNSFKKTIDAEKQYLNVAEIALIVLSVIILILFIILLICFIIRCQRRKRSRDFLSN